MADHSSTRRNLVAAMALLPVAIAAVASPASAYHSTDSRAAWDAAMKRMLKAKAASDNYTASVWDVAYEAELANERAHGLDWNKRPENYTERRLQIPNRNRWLTDEISDRQEALMEEYCRLQDKLLAMPAPDLKAAVWKLDHFFAPEDDGFTASWKQTYLQPTLDDFRRLASS